MKTILFDLNEKEETEKIAALLLDLKRRNVRAIFQTADLQKEEELLMITDSQEAAKHAKQCDIACVVYEKTDTAKCYGVDMVIQSFEELNTEFFELIYKRHHGLPWVIVETDRLLIRESIMADFEAMYALYQEPGMTDFMPGLSTDKKEERDKFEWYIKNKYAFFGYGLWSVMEKESGTLVGRAGFENSVFQERNIIELEYMIGASAQAQGYGQETVRALISYAEHVLDIRELYTFIQKGNQRSIHMMDKFGFTEIGSQPQEVLVFRKKKGGFGGINR